MSYCSATVRAEKTRAIILSCNLAEGHETAHPLHFDKNLSLVWREVSNVPAALPATRTTPSPKRLRAAAFTTSQFEVVA